VLVLVLALVLEIVVVVAIVVVIGRYNLIFVLRGGPTRHERFLLYSQGSMQTVRFRRHQKQGLSGEIPERAP